MSGRPKNRVVREKKKKEIHFSIIVQKSQADGFALYSHSRTQVPSILVYGGDP